MGLNPLLKNFWMISHPPLLFLGYSLSFLFFINYISDIITKKSINITKQTSILLYSAAIVTLSGIFTGGIWSYSVLGWGGFWGWDPIENSSLVPFLFILSTIHSLFLTKKNDSFLKTIFITSSFLFLSILFGAYLTRSGLLSDISLHSFASSNIKIPLMLVLLISTFAISLLYFKKIHKVNFKNNRISTHAKTSIIYYFILGLNLFSALVIISIIIPIISSYFYGFKFSLNQDFYKNISIPFAIFFTLAYLVYYSIKIEKKNITKLLIIVPLIILPVIISFSSFRENLSSISIWIISLSVSSIFITLLDSAFKKFKNKASMLCHTGYFIFMIGIIFSHGITKELAVELILNQEKDINGMNLTFKGRMSKEELLFEKEKNSDKNNFKMIFHNDENSKNQYKEPNIIHGFLTDIHISPIEYIKGSNRTNLIKLTLNQTATIDNYKITLIKYTPMVDEQNFLIGTNLTLKITKNQSKYELTIKRIDFILDNNKNYVENKGLPGSRRNFYIKSYDNKKFSAELKFNLLEEDKVEKDSIIVKISYKYLFSFVIIGFCFIIGGLFIKLFSFKKYD